jgi:hypothetical protein
MIASTMRPLAQSEKWAEREPLDIRRIGVSD